MNRAPLYGAAAGPLRRWAPVIAAAAVILVLGLGEDTLREWGRFEHQRIVAGEAWRLVTSHLVHLSWGHLWLNLIALLLMAALFDDAMAPGDWLLGGALAAAAIDAGLMLYHRELAWYVGLSGVLHGLMVIGAAGLVRAGSAIGYVLLAGVAAKLCWEQLAGPLPFSESTSGGPVLVDAHLYGTLGGVAALVARHAARRLRARPARGDAGTGSGSL